MHNWNNIQKYHLKTCIFIQYADISIYIEENFSIAFKPHNKNVSSNTAFNHQHKNNLITVDIWIINT